MIDETTTSDGCETFIRDRDASDAFPTVATYISTSDPEHRVVIEYDQHPGYGPFEWDTWLSCYAGKGHDGKERRHYSIHLWHPDSDGTLPGESIMLDSWQRVSDLDDDELADLMPTSGTIIGLDYWGGNHLRVNDSPDPRDWDGYFHITEAHWRALMGDDERGRTYTSREAHLRETLAGDCESATAWITGDVLAWRLERAETWTNERTGQTRTTWETVEAVCGYYGTDDRTITDMVHEGFDMRPKVDTEVAA